eukprot:gene10766-7494_t
MKSKNNNNNNPPKKNEREREKRCAQHVGGQAGTALPVDIVCVVTSFSLLVEPFNSSVLPCRLFLLVLSLDILRWAPSSAWIASPFT